VSWFTGGEIFRSGACYRRGKGKVFYFRPGHETLPTYHNVEIQRVIFNGVRWAAPTESAPMIFGNAPSLEGATA
jgi:trehalose utilization protein